MADKLALEKKREWGEMLFCKERLTQKEIAEKIGVSEVTVSKWKEKFKWDDKRASISITKEEQIRRVYDQLKAINEKIVNEQKGIPTSADADILSKLSTVIEKLEKETSITEIISVSMKFLEWLRPVNTDKAKELSSYFDAFIKDCLK